MKKWAILFFNVALAVYVGAEFYGTYNWVAYFFWGAAVFYVLIAVAPAIIMKTASQEKIGVALEALKEKGMDVSSFEKKK